MENSKYIPNLYLAGFAKSGTSTLHDLLVQHPKVFSGGVKEPHTYTNEKKYRNRHNGSFSQSLVRLYGSNKGQFKYILDSSTSYSVNVQALERIKNDCENAKIILILRDPFDRIRSHYRWMVSLGFVEKPFVEEIKQDYKNPYSPKINYWGNFKNYIYFSKYAFHLKNIYNIFDRSQVFVLNYESFVEDQQGTLDSIFKFLELNRITINSKRSNSTKSNVSKKPRSPLVRTKYILRRLWNKLVLKQPISPRIRRPLAKVPDITLNEIKSIYPLLKVDIEDLTKFEIDTTKWRLYKEIVDIE